MTKLVTYSTADIERSHTFAATHRFYDAADVEAVLCEARQAGMEEAAVLVETRFHLPGNAALLAAAIRAQAEKETPQVVVKP